MPVDADRFRAIAGSFPSGVTVVTALTSEGSPRGLATSAFCSVSLDPPMVLVCLDRDSRTLEAIRASGAFVVNVLSADRVDLARRFATKDVDKFGDVAWRPAALAKGAPVLADGAIAHAECLAAQVIKAGDHFVVIGSVEGGEARDGAPLVYFRRSYGNWASGERSGGRGRSPVRRAR